MDKNQQESRRSATREFISSLDTLKAVLRSDDSAQDSRQPAKSEAPVPQPPEPPLDGDLESLLDDAVRDIERFMSEQPSE